MKRIENDRYGGADEMRLRTFELGGPGKRHISVRVMVASENPVDWKVRNGALKSLAGSRFPRKMGTDFSGVVEATGPGVSRLKPGDAVFGTSRWSGVWRIRRSASH